MHTTSELRFRVQPPLEMYPFGQHLMMSMLHDFMSHTRPRAHARPAPLRAPLQLPQPLRAPTSLGEQGNHRVGRPGPRQPPSGPSFVAARHDRQNDIQNAPAESNSNSDSTANHPFHFLHQPQALDLGDLHDQHNEDDAVVPLLASLHPQFFHDLFTFRDDSSPMMARVIIVNGMQNDLSLLERNLQHLPEETVSAAEDFWKALSQERSRQTLTAVPFRLVQPELKAAIFTICDRRSSKVDNAAAKAHTSVDLQYLLAELLEELRTRFGEEDANARKCSSCNSVWGNAEEDRAATSVDYMLASGISCAPYLAFCLTKQAAVPLNDFCKLVSNSQDSAIPRGQKRKRVASKKLKKASIKGSPDPAQAAAEKPEIPRVVPRPCTCIRRREFHSFHRWLKRRLKTEEEEKKRLEAARSVVADKKVADLCAICQDEIVPGQQLDVLRCGHLFHKSETCSVSEWIAAKGECPVCRQPVC
jgi:hypothetical protein